MTVVVSASPHQDDAPSKTARRIRVGYVMHVMQVAGAELLVKRLIDDLEETVEPTIFCLDGIGEVGFELQRQGVPVFCLDRVAGIDWRLPRRLAKLVKQQQIDILHAHQYTPFFYSALAKIFGMPRTQIVFTEHGRHYPDVVSSKRRLVNRYVLQRFAAATNACCDFSARAVESKDGFPKVETIRNGVDVSCFQPAASPEENYQLRDELGIGRDEFCVVCVARFHSIKDHATLLRAWKKVVHQIRHARLLLVGDGSERPAMEDFVAESELENSVSFLGIRSDIKELLQAADVFTMASLSEASSLTLLEAMACGCPSVVTDVGGNGEHVRDGIEGRLVPRQDPDSLAAAIVSLSDLKIAGKMGGAARERVSRDFEIAKTVGSYMSLYERVISNSAVAK